MSEAIQPLAVRRPVRVHRVIDQGGLVLTCYHVVQQHLRPNSGLFLPTPEWDRVPSNDRPWS